MRFRLTLHIDRSQGDLLPFNYQHEQSAVIYHILSQADEQYATWLHDNGYQTDNGKRFKLFAYSRFSLGSYAIDKRSSCLIIMSDWASWTISFLPEKSTQKFIQGLFANQHFIIGDKFHKVAFDVMGVETLPAIEVTPLMSFRATSPVCVKEHIGDQIRYMSPKDSNYGEAILKGLLARYETLNGAPFTGDVSNFHFTLIDTKVKSALIAIKSGTPQQTFVKGYLYSFKMTGPEELLRLAAEGGIGEECSQGFGYIIPL
ncbi:MAG: CRISPR-associated endoribonuclease Cas6 [Bacteroidales bacterium]|jgi:CRISPR-associated endoribonuclease Cas6|nr:CRISPR-associated endoribonuclease Cas6 [Bacteroidales bacterium]MCI2133632.1 CRISPR-associated endoribonuclease Cas6 [Bacteroidales bacterium]